MKKRILLFVLILIATLSLCACGSQASNTVPESNKSEEIANTEPSQQAAEPAQEEPEPEPEETAEEVKTEENGIRPEIKEAIDSYEAFVDSYCKFLETYDSADLTMLARYTQLLNDCTEMSAKFEAMENEELNDAELAYYTEVSLRCSSKMLEASANLTSGAGDMLSGMSGLMNPNP